MISESAALASTLSVNTDGREMKPTKFAMALTRMTNGTVVYDSPDPDAPVRTLYITKASLDRAPAPASNTVSIEPQAA